MLDPWIIEEIRRREEERRRDQESRVDVPLESPSHYDRTPAVTPAEESDRGVTIIDL